MYNLFEKKKHEITAVNLTSTKPPTPSREAVPIPQANTLRAAKSNEWEKQREGRKNRSHARADHLINLVTTKIILILRQYKQNTMMSLTGCSSIKEK